MRKLIFIILFNFFLINKSFALIEIDITRGNLDPLPIAISPLHVDIKSESYDSIKIKELGEDISKIIENNFRSTGLFNPLKKLFSPIAISASIGMANPPISNPYPLIVSEIATAFRPPKIA